MTDANGGAAEDAGRQGSGRHQRPPGTPPDNPPSGPFGIQPGLSGAPGQPGRPEAAAPYPGANQGYAQGAAPPGPWFQSSAPAFPPLPPQPQPFGAQPPGPTFQAGLNPAYAPAPAGAPPPGPRLDAYGRPPADPYAPPWPYPATVPGPAPDLRESWIRRLLRRLRGKG